MASSHSLRMARGVTGHTSSITVCDIIHDLMLTFRSRMTTKYRYDIDDDLPSSHFFTTLRLPPWWFAFATRCPHGPSFIAVFNWIIDRPLRRHRATSCTRFIRPMRPDCPHQYCPKALRRHLFPNCWRPTVERSPHAFTGPRPSWVLSPLVYTLMKVSRKKDTEVVWGESHFLFWLLPR
jgi:hypothetical protein